MHITVLGAGLVGSAIVKDLAQEPDFSLTVVDINADALRALAATTSVHIRQADMQQPGAVASLVADADLVVCAVPGFMGFRTLEEVIKAGKSVVDISFFTEDPFALDALAKARGVTAVVDCGVAPGLSNLIAGYAASQMDRVERFVCYVGGLPQIRQWPFAYKAVFSPIDVLEEYTRPARFVECGQVVVRPALSDVELIDLPGIGTLEAFNTDGLRTLLHTLDAPFKKEKTLRYPGHAGLMRALRDSGFFDTQPLTIGKHPIRPLDLTAALLFKQWQMQPGDEDLTVMRVVVEGEKQGRMVRYTYDLLDKYDRTRQMTAMARTTGFTCALAVRLLAGGLIPHTGIVPPEYLGQTPGLFARFLEGYRQRNITLNETLS